MRLSYSSSTLFQGCQRKFWHRKINQTEVDPDYEENTTALSVGKAFHQVLELCNHERDKYRADLAKAAFMENDIQDPTHQGMILGMVKRYFDLHEKQGLQVLKCEIEIGDENIIGYIDAVMEDEDGNWFIVDLKTAGMLGNSLLARLSKDPQLNIYSYYKDQVAQILGIDVDLFAGVRYRVTTKSKISFQPKKERLTEFAQRVYDRVESYDIFIPADELIAEETRENFAELQHKISEIAELPEHKVPQNFGFCEQYFKPCEFWSRCYGGTFTTIGKKHKLVDSTNATKFVHEKEQDFGAL